LADILLQPVERGALISTASTESVIRQVFPDARITAIIGPTNPTTLAWVQQYVGQQIVEIGTNTLANVRTIVHNGFVQARTVDQIARDLREHIGLTSRQGQALQRLRQVLTEEGIAPRRIEERVAARGRRMLRDRARNIARHEALEAVHNGQLLNWQAAEQQGLWDPRFRRVFILTPDDRLCPSCREVPRLNPNGVGLYEDFQTPYGPKRTPPIHVL
jgi:hypothetical protein